MSSKRDILRPPRPSVFTPFLRRWFTDERARELQETRELYKRVRQGFAASAWDKGDYTKDTDFSRLFDTVEKAIDNDVSHPRR
jgi:hypothetical protein